MPPGSTRATRHFAENPCQELLFFAAVCHDPVAQANLHDAVERRLRSRWLNSTVMGVGLASLCSDAGHEMATAALPVLLATLGAGSASLGLIEGLADGLSSFVKLYSGLYSDRLRRRKPLAVVAYLVPPWAWRVLPWLGNGGTCSWDASADGSAREVPSARSCWPRRRPPNRMAGHLDLNARWIARSDRRSPAFFGLGDDFRPPRDVSLYAGAGLVCGLCMAFLVRERPHTPQPHARLWGSVQTLPGDFNKYLVGIGIAGIGDF